MDTQEWADRTVSVHEVGGRWEVRLWMGVTLKGADHWAEWTWMPLASFDSQAEANSYRAAAAQILENALRLSLNAIRDGTLVARQFPELKRQLAQRRKGGLTVGAALTAEVDLLRHALAGVWTELGKDAPDLEGVRRLAEQALRMTSARHGEDLTFSEMGVGGWDEYVVECIDRRVRRGEGG